MNGNSRELVLAQSQFCNIFRGSCKSRKGVLPYTRWHQAIPSHGQKTVAT